MLIEIVIGVSVVSVSIASICIASLSYVKKLHNDEERWERLEDERIQKLNAPPPTKEELSQARINNVKVLWDVYGETLKCPLCGWQLVVGDKMPSGFVCKDLMDNGDLLGLKEYSHKGTVTSGPSSGMMVFWQQKAMLYQACTRCLGEWLCRPSTERGISR